MASLQIDSVASHVEDTMLAEAVPRPSNIKIKFKKGAMFADPSDKSAAINAMVSQLPIRPSPGSEKKRKAAEDTGFENDEHVVKRIKAGESSEAAGSIAVVSTYQTNEKVTSPTSSTATTTATGASKKGPAQAASIFRKLAKKLATQPLLLDHVKEYRSSINAQRREDLKLIASLRAQLSTTTKEAAEKELRAAEELKASQEMVEFWTDSCNEEFERAILIRERVRGLVSKVEAIGKADAVGDVSAGFGKGMQIEFELQKLGAEMKNTITDAVREVGEMSRRH